MKFNRLRRVVRRRLNSDLGNGPYDTASFYTNTFMPLPISAGTLTTNNSRLTDLTRQYRELGDPPCSNWGSPDRNLPYFRADNDYVWQPRYFEDHFEARLYCYAKYVESVDTLRLLERCSEDLLFGAFGVLYKGRIVSRDLLDSVLQINWAYGAVPELRDGKPTVLDLGAGYGRLAHRISEGFSGSWRALCTDGIALSTFLSEWYLQFRQARNVRVIPIVDLRTALRDEEPVIAFNIHSFSEIPVATTLWWLNELEQASVKQLIVVTNERSRQFLSSEVDGRRVDLLPIFDSHGWNVLRQEPFIEDAEIRGDTNVHNFLLHFRWKNRSD